MKANKKLKVPFYLLFFGCNENYTRGKVGIIEQTKSEAEINNGTLWIGRKGKAIKEEGTKGETMFFKSEKSDLT